MAVEILPLVINIPASAPYVGEVNGELAISPDGTRLVYPAIEGGKRLLYMRALDQLDAQPLRGTDDGDDPFFSPDGEWVGFFTGATGSTGTMKKVAVRGGPAITLCAAPAPRGASWGSDDTIIFSSGNNAQGSLQRISAAGGVPTRLTTPDVKKNELVHGWPERLPGGKAVLFSVHPGPGFDAGHIAALSLETGTSHTVIEQGYHAHYVPTGHIVYILGGNLMAVPFDVGRLETTGPTVPVVEGVRGRSSVGNASFGVSRTGFLVYASGGTTSGVRRTLVWVDRQGHEEPVAAPPRAYVYPRLSPDGTRVALDVRDQENDIWVWDLARATLTRITSDPGLDRNPVWTPDGRRIVFSSLRAGGADNLYAQAADGSTSQAARLTESPNNQSPEAFSPDGTHLVFREADPKTGPDLEMLALDGPSTALGAGASTVLRAGAAKTPGATHATPLVHTPFVESNGEISPDGRWLAYESDDSGQIEIYVRPFPNTDSGKWQISTGGGTRPLWAHNGRELFYLAGGSPGPVRMMAVTIQPGATFEAGNAQRLFEGRFFATSTNFARTYDVSLDGRRFLMIKDQASADESSAPSSLIVVLNWFDELKRLAPAKH